MFRFPERTIQNVSIFFHRQRNLVSVALAIMISRKLLFKIQAKTTEIIFMCVKLPDALNAENIVCEEITMNICL
jgi:hypothetical protein